MATRTQTLEKAKACVMVDRQSTHGNPEDSFALIAKFWSDYLGYKIKDYEVAIMLGLLKIARMKHGFLHEDNYTDLAGYAACAGELTDKYRPINSPAPLRHPNEE